MFLDMLNVYKVMSGNILAAIAINGEPVLKQPLIKSMRGIKKETLKLISDWISKSTDPDLVNYYTDFTRSVFILQHFNESRLDF